MTTNQITFAQAYIFAKELITQRCENYGYDYKVFQRISRQRSDARKAFQHFFHFNPETVIQRLANEYRVSLESCKITETLSSGSKIVKEEMRLTYTVGQSNNEEITNLLRRLVNPKAKWVQ
jgi:hypothetical protein